MPRMNKKKVRELIVNGGIFAVVMALTFWSVFRNQNFAEIAEAVGQMSREYLAASVFLAVFFVAGEGCMICYLLKGIGEWTTLPRCISYSFIGFFFSGITPSATGGQPMQLYYMKRDGNSLSASSVVLMTVAVIYKFVLVLIGIGILLFWGAPLRNYLQAYYGLYFLGLFLNVVLVAILLKVMFSQRTIRKCFYQIENIMVRFRLWRRTEDRREKVEQFLSGYQETVAFLRSHKRLIGVTIAGTFLQRFSVFVLTYAVYRGLGLSGVAMLDVVLVQAAVYIAVDMLPIPGAQGITEAMYRCVFQNIFVGKYLVVSVCIARGVSFYLMLLVGLVVFCVVRLERNS
ncbi:MAG: flippase-like domain-containing protein [Lachnospiraceae bacterium]|nr:flippase-like domain-containing protein [Lachnospiraceae bacterium]